MQDSQQILIVDDDSGLRELLTDYLSREGYRVHAVANAEEMDGWLTKEHPDLLILDLMLPGEDGLSIARRMHAAGEIPVIILSARGDEVDRIIGLEVGADDYLAKPFNPRELLARIRAVLRRQGGAPVVRGSAAPGSRPAFGPFQLDLDAQRLVREGQEVPLTAGEFNLLRIFVEHPNRVLDRDRLLDLLKGYEHSPFDRSVDVRVARLRAKIEEDSKAPKYIRTVWGQGYLFAPEGDVP